VSTKPLPAQAEATSHKVAEFILSLAGRIPKSSKRASSSPHDVARALANASAAKAAVISGGLALPPGVLGWVTVLPDFYAIWKLQSQMVSDIAAIYGKSGKLNREQMLYCLFRHAAAQAVRDLVVRAGNRYIVHRTTLRVLESAARKIGVKVTERALGKAAARWIPIVGAVGVGAYAYYDTAQVARTAIELFSGQIELRDAPAD
jgi:hypothetical protein